jgi:predicted transcriptional regulator
MPDALDKAIDKLRDIPTPKRRAAAALIEHYIATEVGGVYELNDEERSLIEDGVAELDRGEYVTAADHQARIADVLKR